VLRFLLALSLSIAAGCGGGVDDPRAAEIADAMTRADLAVIRARPALAAGKYAKMASDPYSYYRGSVPVYKHDWQLGRYGVSTSAFALESPRGDALPGALLPFVVGDAHPENIGILRARDGSFGLEPNDFDGADRAPYLWDLRRLTAGMSLAARLSNPDDPAAASAAKDAARSIARAAAESYAVAMAAFAKGEKRARVTDSGGEVVIEDLFSRSQKDTASRAELDNTILDGDHRTLKRGVLDPEVPYQAWGDLPASAYAALPAAIEAYRQTLLTPPPAEYFTLLDAVRVYGSGVASWPKVRVILLVRGPSDDPADDVMLELKELTDSGALATYPPGVFFDDNQRRVLGVARAVWGIPDADPLWGTTTWLGFDCQIKTESDGEKTFRVKRLTGSRGTPEALTGAARTFGALLARVHATPTPDGASPSAAIAAAIGADPGPFADEQADFAEQYAEVVLADHALFGKALSDLGPTLGVPADPADTPSPDLAAVYGAPPPSNP
jgi:uncharacterized protein (DUF2252 family)